MVQRDAALAALLKEYTGGLVSGLPPAKYEAYVDGRVGKGKASSSGKGSQSKVKSKAKPGQGIGSQSKGAGSTRQGKGSQGGKPSAPSAPLARPRTRPPRGSIGEAATPPWGSAPSSAPLSSPPLAPRSRSPVSARPGAGRGPAPRSPVASRTGGGRGPASPEGARREGPAIRFSKGGDVEAHQLEFLRLYCEVPERWISRQWGGFRHSSGWQVLHFLAQAVNRGHLLAPAGCPRQGLEVLGGADSMLEEVLDHGGDLDATVSESADCAAGFGALHVLAKPYHRWSADQLDDVLSLAKAALQRGCRADLRVPHTGRTPLAIAATAGQEQVARLLVGHGADPTVVEGGGMTPIQLCRRGRQIHMAKVLEELVLEGAVGERRRPFDLADF